MPAGTPSLGASVGNWLLHARHQQLLDLPCSLAIGDLLGLAKLRPPGPGHGGHCNGHSGTGQMG